MFSTKKIVVALLAGIALSYVSVSFYMAEANPFIWPQSSRAAMMFLFFCYVCLMPLVAMLFEDGLD